jgi:disease resistance protein RPM1
LAIYDFDKSRYIRVLNLEGLKIETIPNTIGDLFNLHYLGLRETMVKVLPKSIKKLHNLQTLDLYLSLIQKLPNSIGQLKRLRHLFAEVEVDPTHKSIRMRAGIHLSKDVFYLKDLQTIQSVESNAMVVRELENLTQLRSLRIWNVNENHSSELCRSLSKMHFLSFLCIFASNKHEILHLEGLKLLEIRWFELCGRLKQTVFESTSFQISKGLQDLSLCWSQLQNDPLPSLSQFRNLTHLLLQKAYEGPQLTFQVGWFPKLKRLQLKQMPNLVQVEMEQGTMINLEDIYLLELKGLVVIPRGIEHLISLKEINCQDMRADFGGLSKGIHQLFHFTCHII